MSGNQQRDEGACSYIHSATTVRALDINCVASLSKGSCRLCSQLLIPAGGLRQSKVTKHMLNCEHRVSMSCRHSLASVELPLGVMMLKLRYLAAYHSHLDCTASDAGIQFDLC